MPSGIETRPKVTLEHKLNSETDLNLSALEDHLRQNMTSFVGPIKALRVSGGQSNPTYILTTPAAKYVLRKKPPGTLLPSAHAIEREYWVISALQATEVPVPKVFHLCEDSTVIGTPFYVMEFVEGRIFLDPTLPGMDRVQRSAIYDSMNQVAANLHGVDVDIVGLSSFRRPGNYLERQISRWSRQYIASETVSIPAMRRLIDWLPSHIPGRDSVGLVHGDLRIDNLVFHPTEPKVVAVLDWELWSIGDPMADFAHHMLSWHLRGGPIPWHGRTALGKVRHSNSGRVRPSLR